MKNKLSKIIDKLGMAASLSTPGMLGGLVWGLPGAPMKRWRLSVKD